MTLESNLASLRTELTSPATNVQKCAQLLSAVKVELLERSFLPTGAGESANPADLQLAREALELGVFWSIKAKDVAAFQKYYVQLRSYYFDYDHLLPASPHKHEILGLNLMRLLTQNRIAEFHSELELLNPKDLHGDKFINHSVNMEQYLMEGSYNKIFLVRDRVPSPSYTFFMETLMNTIRNAVADSSEQVYTDLKIVHAQRLLNLTNTADLKAFAEARHWQVDGDRFLFHQEDKGPPQVPAYELLEKNFQYAKELEKIV